jgi:hypothetical protein
MVTPVEEAVWEEVLRDFWLLSDLSDLLVDARFGDASAQEWVTSAGIEAFADALFAAIPDLDIPRAEVIKALERREGIHVEF